MLSPVVPANADRLVFAGMISPLAARRSVLPSDRAVFDGCCAVRTEADQRAGVVSGVPGFATALLMHRQGTCAAATAHRTRLPGTPAGRGIATTSGSTQIQTSCSRALSKDLNSRDMKARRIRDWWAW